MCNKFFVSTKGCGREDWKRIPWRLVVKHRQDDNPLIVKPVNRMAKLPVALSQLNSQTLPNLPKVPWRRRHNTCSEPLPFKKKSATR